MLSKVVFPAPLGPIIADTLPDLNMPVMFLKMTLSLYYFVPGRLKCIFFLSIILTLYEMSLNAISIPFFALWKSDVDC